jgi:copper chaperone CopZ
MRALRALLFSCSSCYFLFTLLLSFRVLSLFVISVGMNTLSRLLILLSLFLLQPLSAEIYEIQLTIGNMVCPYCAKAVVEDVKEIKGVETVKVWPQEGIGLISWKDDEPFQCAQLFRTFARTQFALRQITIDVEGTIEKRRGALTLRSEPENSVFYIDNGESLQVSKLKEGELVRVRGLVTNQQGFNILVITTVLPPV